MIPADHIAIGGDTAWWVVSPPVDAHVALDRPCDTCEGHPPEWDHYGICSDCDGTGRHTFEVEVCHDRRCATCHGSGLTAPPPDFWKPQRPCPDCGGTGRHTFDIEVDAGEWSFLPHTYRVSVVPGMVLPIVDNFEWPETHASVDTLGNVWEPGIARDGEPEWRLIDHATLPPAAAPGMWAVQLRKANR